MGQASPRLSPGTQQLTEQKSAVASGSGTATFTFDSPPSGFVKSGTLQCLGAPATGVFVAMIGATQWGDWAGNSVGGPVQATQNEQLVVTATGLTPGATFLMSWIGSLDQEGYGQPEWPDPNTSVLESAILGSIVSQAGAPTAVFGPSLVSAPAGSYHNVNVPVGPSARTMIIAVTSASVGLLTTGIVNVIGNQTLKNYYNQPPYLVNTTATWLIVVPILGIVDTSYTVNLNGVVTGTNNVNVSIYTDTFQYDENVFYNGIVQAISGVLAAVGSTVVLVGPARLFTLHLEALGNGVTAEALSSGLLVARIDGPAGALNGWADLTFPPNTILQAGQNVTLTQAAGAGASVLALTYAYP